MKCLICLKEFNSVRSLTTHIRIHNVTTKEYYDKYYKKENEGKCIVCKKDTKFYYITTGYNKYCGASCGSINTLKQREYTCLKKYGFKNPKSNQFVIDKTKKTCIKNLVKQQI